MEHQLDATITVVLIFKISSTCFGQAFAHLQERNTDFLQPAYHINRYVPSNTPILHIKPTH
jgi:hypothetical protein